MAYYTYARYSTDRQTEASITDQQRVCHEYAARHDWRIAADYVDQGISGAALGNRPGVQAALAAMQPGDVLLVADLSRLSRSQELAPLIDRIRFRSARVIGVLDGFDSNSPQARMQAGLSGIMSDELRASIRQRVHLALESRAKTSRPTGGKAYGFDHLGKVVPHEADVVREIFARYAAGESLRAIASELNIRGVPSPGAGWHREQRRRDGRWIVSALHPILRNERYIGKVVWNRSQFVKNPDTGRRIRRERPASDWIAYPCESIVDEKTWAQVQARHAERHETYGSNKGGLPRYLLSGLLECSACGSKLIVSGKAGSHYYCGTRRQGGPSACSMALGVQRSIAEDVILGPIREELLSPAAVEAAVQMIREWYQQDAARAAQGVSPEMAAIDEEIADLESLIAERPSRAQSLRVSIEKLHEQRSALQRAAWRGSAKSSRESLPAEIAYRDAVARFGDSLGAGLQQARETLRQILGTIRVEPAASGEHLVARVGINPVPLLRLAGVAWVGSGGVIQTQAYVMPLIRVA